MRDNFICKQAIRLKFTVFDRKVLPPNFKAVGLIDAELHILKGEKLDACIKPLFTNSVTYVTGPVIINHVSANYTELYFRQYLQL